MGWGLRADAAHGRCYSLEVQTGKVSSWGPEELVLWEEVTQRLSWVPCPSPVSQGMVFLPPLQHCSAPWRGSSRWGGGELWATFPLLHGGFPCWTSSSLHVQWELGADLEQLSWSLLEPCSPQTLTAMLSPLPSLLLPAPLESFRLCWDCLLHAACLSPFPVPGVGSTRCEGTLTAEAFGTSLSVIRGADACQAFRSETGYVTPAKPPTNTFPNVNPVAKPKNASCS